MSDVAQPAKRETTLFDLLPPAEPPTRRQGLFAAARTAKARYRQITQLLEERGPLAGWEIAAALGCQLHQVSGRLTEMRQLKLIENTGERRKNPRMNTAGEVVRLVAGFDRTELTPDETTGAGSDNYGSQRCFNLLPDVACTAATACVCWPRYLPAQSMPY